VRFSPSTLAMEAWMTTWRSGWGAAWAWAVGICAALATPAMAGGGLVREPTFSTVIVSGGEVTEHTHEGYVGFYYAFNRDLDRDGFILRMLGSRGFYEYDTNHATYWQGDVMLGYQWVRGGFDVGVYVGVDHQDYDLNEPDASNELQGSETGFKAAFELESNGRGHSPYYFALRGSYSTAFDSYYALGRVGHSLGRFTVGPEAWVLGDVSGDAQRLGAFISFDVGLGPHTLGAVSFSVGHQFGDDNNGASGRSFDDGVYGTVKLWIALP
jgi:Cellulose biosynthesis protein BcsS